MNFKTEILEQGGEIKNRTGDWSLLRYGTRVINKMNVSVSFSVKGFIKIIRKM